MGRGSRERGRPPLPAATGLGRRVRDARLRLGLTQAELGAPIYKAGSLSDVEHGRISPSRDALEHIARGLGLIVGDLTGRPEPPLRPEEAFARAHQLLADALRAADAADKPIVSAAALALDALRRRLTPSRS